MRCLHNLIHAHLDLKTLKVWKSISVFYPSQKKKKKSVFYNFKLYMPISMILGKQIKFSSTLAKKEKGKVLKKKKIIWSVQRLTS